jgi:hypothetical protein
MSESALMEDAIDDQSGQGGRSISEELPNHELYTTHIELEKAGNELGRDKTDVTDRHNHIPESLMRELFSTVRQAIKSELTSAIINLKEELKNDQEECTKVKLLSAKPHEARLGRIWKERLIQK